MKPPRLDRRVFRAILTGAYSQKELHEFVQVCYALALPHIRKRIGLGRINPGILGLREADIVQDCLADLFRRDGSSGFPEINRFFDGIVPGPDTGSDERIVMKLRQLVLGKCHNNLVRLHAEADPSLGRIIRNVMLAIDRTGLFVKHLRFGEMYLVARVANTLPHRPPMPVEVLSERLSPVVSMHDTIPRMMQKVHAALADQREYQRSVPLVGVSLIFKEVYARGGDEAGSEPDGAGESDDVRTSIEGVVREYEKQMYRKYVESGKRTPGVFHGYMLALDELLTDVFISGNGEGTSYLEYLKRQMPGLTKSVYMKEHRSVFEYLAKTVKARAGARLKKIVREDRNV